MVLSFIILLATCIYSVLLQDVSWLPCELVEEQIQLDEKGLLETRYHHRNAVLRFGQPGDRAVNSDSITFFVSGTGKKLDIRRYVDQGVESLRCEIRWYSTDGIQVRWPHPRAQERDIWFRCTLHHGSDHVVLTAFLRHTPDTPTDAQEDYRKTPVIEDKASLVTAVAMLVLTEAPSVDVGLLREQTLPCRFAVDHARPAVELEWTLRRRGERSRLFRYSGRSGRSEGAGVSLGAIAEGDGSLHLPAVSLAGEGTYVCSVSVAPLYASHDVDLQIVESPQVSLNVGATLTLQEGQEQKVSCQARGYYPLDVQLEWLRERRGEGSRLPEVLRNVLFTSHQRYNDGTYSLSAFFLLRPAPADSGCTYTCRASHRSLRVPIRKSVTLTVTESTDWGSVLLGVGGIGFAAIMLALLLWMLRYLHAIQEGKKRKPY